MDTEISISYQRFTKRKIDKILITRGFVGSTKSFEYIYDLIGNPKIETNGSKTWERKFSSKYTDEILNSILEIHTQIVRNFFEKKENYKEKNIELQNAAIKIAQEINGKFTKAETTRELLKFK